jgi:electron transfer flavoprotein beta subunit
MIVCIKPVPDSKYWDKLRLDATTRTLRREGIPTIISPLDLNAIEEALRIKEARGGKVTVISMGPNNTVDILAWAYAYGVDDAVLLTDRAFAGADTWATAYALAAGIKKIGQYDLVLLGNESLDGSTGQVGPQVAEFLGIPHVTYVDKVDFVNDNTVQARSKIEMGYMLVETQLPATLAVTKDINTPRIPPVFGAIWATEKSAKCWSAADVGVDKSKIGLAGSPTSVSDVSTIEIKRRGEILSGETGKIAKQLVEKLRADGVLP